MNLHKYFTYSLTLALALGAPVYAQQAQTEQPSSAPALTSSASVAETSMPATAAQSVAGENVTPFGNAHDVLSDPSVESTSSSVARQRGHIIDNSGIVDGKSAVEHLEHYLLRTQSEQDETVAPAGDVYTVDSTVDRALEHNHDIKAANEQVTQAEARYEQAQAAKNVQVNLSNVTTYQNRHVVGGEVALKNWCDQFTASISKLLTTFGKVENQIAAAYLEIAVQKFSALQTRHSVKYAAKQAFFNRLKADAQVDVAVLNLDLNKESRSDAERMYKQGVMALYDVIQADLSVTEAEEQLARVNTDVDIAEAVLLEAMDLHREGDEFLTLVRPGVIDVDPDCTLGDLQNLALTQRYEIKGLDGSVDAIKKTRQAAEAQNLPEIGVSGNYVYSHNYVGSPINLLQLNLNIGWNAWDGGERKALIKEIDSQLVALGHEREELCHAISLEVEKAWHKFKLTDITMLTARKRVESAWVSHAMTRQRFLNGLGTSLEVQSALTDLNNARQAFVVASYDRDLAFADLEYQVGVDFPNRKLSITPELLDLKE